MTDLRPAPRLMPPQPTIDTPRHRLATDGAFDPRPVPARVPRARPTLVDEGAKTLLHIQGLSFWYGDNKALKDISLQVSEKRVTAFIGPSGCGKSTLLRCINRMNDLIEGTRHEGSIALDGIDVYDERVDPVALRRHIGMVFQKPNPFPKSIYENIAYGVRLQRSVPKAEMDQIVEDALRKAHLWDEVADRLKKPATGLSGGQQQRLCIARALAVEPRVLLMDEPCSALDPIATTKIEDLISELKSEVSVIIVTHNMQQAARVSDRTAFFYLGELIEEGRTRDIFEAPANELTERYITGRFG